MGREVRRVPADWQHPKDEQGRFIPLFGGSFAMRAERWDEEAAQWENGFIRRFVDGGGWEPKPATATAQTFAEWDGERPERADYMPDWPKAERTYFQMYETTSEGTPISPVMESPEALARWLADNNASSFGRSVATYEQWLATIRRGSAPSAIIIGGRMLSGVEGLAEPRSS